jgi:glycosyltransferase involved in cell wall biosynthesis
MAVDAQPSKCDVARGGGFYPAPLGADAFIKNFTRLLMHILFISRWYPFPPDNGSKLRIYNLLRGLSTRHEIDLVSFADRLDIDPVSPEIRSICRDIKVVQYKPYHADSLHAYLGFFSLLPRAIADSYSKEMQDCIKQQVESRAYDLVIASQSAMASYCRGLNHIPVLLEEVEIGVLLGQFQGASSAWRRLRNGLTWYKFRNYLALRLRSCSACTVVSEQEKSLVTRNIPYRARIEVIPNCISLVEYQAVIENYQPNTLIFTGSFRYQVNYDAMLWFLTDVFPLIQAEIADVKLMITGDHANLPLPMSEGITLTGFVKDIRPLVARSAVSIAPLLAGGGTRLKILEAMALRTPVVSTSKGAEGLDITHERDILIADSPVEYAGAVCRLLREADLREKLVKNACQLVADKYNWVVVIPKFLGLVESIVDTRKSYEYRPDPI